MKLKNEIIDRLNLKGYQRQRQNYARNVAYLILGIPIIIIFLLIFLLKGCTV